MKNKYKITFSATIEKRLGYFEIDDLENIIYTAVKTKVVEDYTSERAKRKLSHQWHDRINIIDVEQLNNNYEREREL